MSSTMPGLRRAIDRLGRLTGWRADLAAASCGVLAALALPPFTLTPLLLLAIPGLLCLLGGTASAWGAARRGFVFGMAHHLVGLYWVTNAILVQAADFWWAVPIAVPLLAAVLSAFIALPCAVARRVTPGWRRASVLAGMWVFGDLARQFVLTGFPWNPLGSIWELPGLAGLIFMQPAAWVGVPGLTLGTLILAATPVLGWRGRVGNTVLFGAWALFGAIRLHFPAPPDRALDAVIVQGNVSEIEHRDHWRDRDWVNQVFDRHLALTRQGMAQAGDTPAMLVWPETASPFWLQGDAGARRAIAEAMVPAVAGLIGSPRDDPAHGPHNSMIVLGPDGAVLDVYDKHHLVPYGEYFPSYLPIRLGEQGWSPGTGLKTLHIPGLGAIGPLICYEAIFPAQAVVESDRPALMVNITNDSWFGDSAGPRQHLAAARMRCVEEGLPMVRAANTGISAVIDAHGRIVAALGLNTSGVLVAKLPSPLAATPFSRMGLAAPALLALLTASLGFGVARKRMGSLFID
jgi:apolipoprotein N-acyltransferase